MSETAGGCVYDGVPLGGVEVTLDPASGQVTLGGPVVARGYRHGAAFEDNPFTPGKFRTSDVAQMSDGVIQVFGRVDDIINTGGEKVAPATVEAALRQSHCMPPGAAPHVQDMHPRFKPQFLNDE